MKIREYSLYLLTMFLLVGLTANFSVAMSLSEDIIPSESLLLSPGMASSCQNDFIVENLSDETSELQIVLGNENFLRDRINGQEAKSYGLQHSLSMAKMQGKKVDGDDVFTILNIGKEAVRVYCVE